MGEPAPLSPANRAMQAALIVDEPRTEVLLLRHGQQHYADDSAVRRDALDPPLSELGRRQARAVGRHVARLGVVAVYSSGMRRAVETAALLREGLGSEPVIGTVPDLREVEIFRDASPDRPVGESMTPDVLAFAAEEFMKTRRFEAFPSAEPSVELRARAVRALEQITDRHRGQRVAVVAHGGLINAFLAEVLGMTADMFFFPAHASVTRALNAEGRWALGSANETAHLHDLAGPLVSY